MNSQSTLVSAVGGSDDFNSTCHIMFSCRKYSWVCMVAEQYGFSKPGSLPFDGLESHLAGGEDKAYSQRTFPSIGDGKE